jgi:hypothetical protein
MMEKAVSGSVKPIEELHKRTLEIQERLRKEEEERLATGVIYLPTWREDRRGSPNSFLRSALFAAIQSKDRVYLEKAELFTQEGIGVTYTGKQLNQEDLTVWLALVDLMKKDPLGTECSFTAHSILKYMGLEIGGSGYERLGVFCITPRKGGFWKIRFSITPLKPLPVNKRLSQKLQFLRRVHIVSFSMSQNALL